jgi:hypothetical protein
MAMPLFSNSSQASRAARMQRNAALYGVDLGNLAR